MKPTVIFFQKGASAAHFRVFIEQAVRFCQSADVVAITDGFLNMLPCPTFPLSEYEQSSLDFEKNYVHLSTNGYHVELICIQRWFVINEFIQKKGINKYYTPDSDVLLFCDIGKEFSKFEKYDFTLSMRSAPGQSFWMSSEVMNEFCKFAMDIYSNQGSDKARQIFSHYTNLRSQGKPGGVCDMTLWEHFIKNRDYKVGETTDIIENSIFDHNFYMAYDGYAHDGQNKIIQWSEGLPYCLRNGELIRFNSFHLSCRRNLAPLMFEKSTKYFQKAPND